MTTKRPKTIKLVEPQPPSKKEKARIIKLVEPPPPSKKQGVTYVEVVEPPPPSRRRKEQVIKLVAAPDQIIRSLRGSRVLREHVSETDAKKLSAIRDADDLTRLILRFLLNHADQGFTATEISNAVEDVGRNKVRLLLAGLGVEYRRHGKVLFSINPPKKQTTRTIEILET